MNFVGTEIAGRTDVWNVIEGKNNGSRIVAFDCRIGYGKASWRTTVIATQGQRRVSGLAAYALKVERAEGWSLVYRPNGLSFPKSLMPVAEFAAHLQSVG